MWPDGRYPSAACLAPRSADGSTMPEDLALGDSSLAPDATMATQAATRLKNAGAHAPGTDRARDWVAELMKTCHERVARTYGQATSNALHAVVQLPTLAPESRPPGRSIVLLVLCEGEGRSVIEGRAETTGRNTGRVQTCRASPPSQEKNIFYFSVALSFIFILFSFHLL